MSDALMFSSGGLYESVADGAGPHNSIYRGKFLGTSVTDAQYKAISEGTFIDLFIGDYWTIGGVNYRIAAFNYYYNIGNLNFTRNHAVMVPDNSLYNARMNTTNTTTGGYVGSEMYKSNLEQAKTIIKNAFGSAHVLTKREFLVDAVSNNVPSRCEWFDSQVDLMNEAQVYGTVAWGVYGGNGYNTATGSGQFPLFMFDRTKLNIRDNYWLRDVVPDIYFSRVAKDGNAVTAAASATLGVRPAFCIG